MAIGFLSFSLKLAKQDNFSAKFEVPSTHMRLCMNLNLQAEKQNYYISVLCCYNRIFRFLY